MISSSQRQLHSACTRCSWSSRHELRVSEKRANASSSNLNTNKFCIFVCSFSAEAEQDRGVCVVEVREGKDGGAGGVDDEASHIAHCNATPAGSPTTDSGVCIQQPVSRTLFYSSGHRFNVARSRAGARWLGFGRWRMSCSSERRTRSESESSLHRDWYEDRDNTAKPSAQAPLAPSSTLIASSLPHSSEPSRCSLCGRLSLSRLVHTLATGLSSLFTLLQLHFKLAQT